jgi:hypothetical protein
MQMVNVFLCRDSRRYLFALDPFGNRLIFLGLAVEAALILGIVYTPLGNRLFGAAPLDAAVWLYLITFVPGMLLLEELRKAWVRSRLPPGG